MRHWRPFLRILNIVVALSCVLQLITPALGDTAFASAAPPRPVAIPASFRAVAVPATPPTGQNLQTLLNLVVRQAVAANGWTVTALASQLNPSDPATSLQAGTGQWQVQALDEKQQPLTLQGALNYQVAAQGQGSQVSNGSVVLSGTLQAADVALALDVSSQLQNDGGKPTSTSRMQLRLTRNGQTLATDLNTLTQTNVLAYNLTQVVAHSTINRDGKTGESKQTLTTLDLGRGESEVWLQADSQSGSGAPTNLAEHLFQRASSGSVMQFLDRYDLKTADNRYSLQAPASVDGTLDGSMRFSLTLVDQNGKTIGVTSPAVPGTGLSSQRIRGLAMPLPADSTPDSVHTPPSLASAQNFGNGGRIPPPAGDCGAQIAFGLGVGVALMAAFALVAIFTAPLAGVIFIAGALASAAETTIALAAITAGSAFLVSYVASGECNADPYFISPDSRLGLDRVNPSPLQITRVTGGRVTPPQANALIPAASTVSMVSGSPKVEYRDNANIFVGGALPQGATPIGDWAWDSNRTFGGAAAHTEAPGEGPELQYFIHASHPLTSGPGDELVQYVYLDPQNPPSEIYMQFYIGDGDGEHRAYWGKDQVQTGGKPGTQSLYPLGALPDKGGWVRLRIPADKLGLTGQPINGILFGAFGGQAWWGTTTTASVQTDTAPDQLAVEDAPAQASTKPGAQIAFRLSQATALTIQIVDSNGTQVRTLSHEETRQPGYQVVLWDGKNDGGTLVPDQPYRVRISTGGLMLAETPVTISPFVANISSLRAFSLLRGIDVPIFGEAYGNKFKSYTVEYGDGLNPTAWTTIAESTTARTLPAGGTLSHINAGNLANWNVGVDEFKPWQEPGLNGVYTLRLRVTGSDGREAADTFPVIVGRLAHFAEGGTITSPDGKARLIVPPFATQNPFALLALVPLSQTEPDEGWKKNLPTDMKLAGEVYEIFPADETFRQPAMLELPYAPGSPTDKIGVLLGDGTSGGWRYVGGQVDAGKQTIHVPISNFGSGRALVAPYVSDHFGVPNTLGTTGAPLAFDGHGAAPAVTTSSAPFAFYSDLESNAGEWKALDAATQLTLVKGEAAGLTNDEAALEVTRSSGGGVRLVQVHATQYDAAKFPILTFDYRLPPGAAPDLLVKSNGTWWQFQMGSSSPAARSLSAYYFMTAASAPLTADDAWHHYQLDLLAELRAIQPGVTNFQVDEIALGQVHSIGYLQYVPQDDGVVGSSYYLTNFAALAPVSANSISFTLAAPSGANFSAYSYALDQKSDTNPPTTPQSTSNQIQVSLPAGAADGVWYFHVRGKGANGQWSASAHFPLLVDRQPPQIGRSDPANGGAGSPDQILAPISDLSGIDFSGLHLTLNGKAFTPGSGLTYQPDLHALVVTPSQLNPAPPEIPNGQRVDLSLSGVKDYAGNQVSAPFGWSFTADRPKVTGDAFRLLTVDGGESPALSPDGSQVAFISSRSGLAKVWVMRADDYEEKANSARQLTNSSAQEASPAWSPDGTLIAYVSDADGSAQVWTSAPDGSGAHALTNGSGSAASPTWSPDGNTLAFIRNGNLWEVGADGTGLHALSNYPEQPLRAVSWQPDGQLFAVDFKLYQETIDTYNPATGQLTSVTEGGQESAPTWLNDGTLLYTAPSSENQPDAVWQVNLYGSGASVISGSGQPGVGDMQPASARNGGALAIVSTRSGSRNIWLRADLQLARLDVSPSIGAAPGTPLQIAYSLPADAQVTLEIANVEKLVDNATQSKGPQTVTWDGAGANGKPVPAGDYLVKLSAQVAGGGEPLERFASARVLDATSSGNLQISISQWANTPLNQVDGLHVQVFPQGSRINPAAQEDNNANPDFKLPAGQYDALVTYNDLRRELDGVVVEAEKTATASIDLGLGALQVTLLAAPGSPVNGIASVQVSRSGDPAQAPVAVQNSGVSNFVLAPGLYDVQAEYQGVRQFIYGLRVDTGKTVKQEISLGAGSFQLKVLAFGGQPAEAGGRLTVQAFTPQDHKTAIATDYNNPAKLLLPAGNYDIQVAYGVAAPNPNTLGAIEEWLNGIVIEPGGTVNQDFDLRLGEVKLDILEATGKPADAKNINLFIYPHGDSSKLAAGTITINSATFQLLPGSYDVVADYANTNLRKQGPIATFQVTAGESVAQTIDLKLGRIDIQVYDASGQLVDGNRLTVQVYPAGTRDTSFAFASLANPLELTVLSDTNYDVVATLDGKKLELAGQSVKEGDTLLLKLNASDFK